MDNHNCLVCEGFAGLKPYGYVEEFPICSPKCLNEWNELTLEEKEDYLALARMRNGAGFGIAYG